MFSGVAVDLTSLLSVGALVIGIVIGFVAGWRIISYKMQLEIQKRIEKEREDAVRMSRFTLTGKFSEQLSPFLPDFPYDPTEVRFVGSPIDFIVFKGLGQRDIREVVFLEVKAGASKLTNTERSLRDTIRAARIRWEQYHAPVPTGSSEDS